MFIIKRCGKMRPGEAGGGAWRSGRRRPEVPPVRKAVVQPVQWRISQESEGSGYSGSLAGSSLAGSHTRMGGKRGIGLATIKCRSDFGKVVSITY